MACRTLLAALLLVWGLLAQAGEIAATIMFASGAPRLIAADGGERPARQGGTVHAGDTLDTRDGRVQLSFRDGASMSLQPATRFRVDDYVFTGESGKAAASDRGFFSLLRGGFRTLTGLIGKERRDQYRVETSVATIGIRGTAYTAQLDDQGLQVRTQAGRVSVCNAAGCIEVGPGEATSVGRPDERPRLQTAVSQPLAVGAPALPTPEPTRSPEVPVQQSPAHSPYSPYPSGPAHYQSPN